MLPSRTDFPPLDDLSLEQLEALTEAGKPYPRVFLRLLPGGQVHETNPTFAVILLREFHGQEAARPVTSRLAVPSFQTQRARRWDVEPLEDVAGYRLVATSQDGGVLLAETVPLGIE